MSQLLPQVQVLAGFSCIGVSRKISTRKRYTQKNATLRFDHENLNITYSGEVKSREGRKLKVEFTFAAGSDLAILFFLAPRFRSAETAATIVLLLRI